MENELIVQDNQVLVPQTLQEEMKTATGNTYCSLDTTIEENRVKLFNIMNKCDGLLRDHVGEVMELKDVYISKFERLEETTGEMKPHYYTVFFLENGTTLCSTAYGIFYSIERLFAIMGFPNTWTKPMSIKVCEKDMKRHEGKSLVVEIALK